MCEVVGHPGEGKVRPRFKVQGVSGSGNSDRGRVPSLFVCVHRCIHLVSVHFLKSEFRGHSLSQDYQHESNLKLRMKQFDFNGGPSL